MDRVRNAGAFALLGVGFAGAGVWVASWGGSPPWLLAAVVVIAMAGAGYTTLARTQLALLTFAVLGVVAMPFVAVGQFGGRPVPAFLVAAAVALAAWVIILRRAMKREWDERWLDAPLEYEIEAIAGVTDDRTEILRRLGFTPSRAYRLAADEDPLSVIYVHGGDRVYAEVTFPRRDELNAGWSFVSLAGPVSLTTQQTKMIASEPGELVQAVLGASLEDGYRLHMDVVRRLQGRGMAFDPVAWAAYRTHIRHEVSRYRTAFRERPYRQAMVVDRLKRHGAGYAVGPLLEQPDAEAQIAAALGLAGVA